MCGFSGGVVRRATSGGSFVAQIPGGAVQAAVRGPDGGQFANQDALGIQNFELARELLGASFSK